MVLAGPCPSPATALFAVLGQVVVPWSVAGVSELARRREANSELNRGFGTQGGPGSAGSGGGSGADSSHQVTVVCCWQNVDPSR